MLLIRALALVITGSLVLSGCVADGPPTTPTSPTASAPAGAAPSGDASTTQPAGMSWSRAADIPTPRSEVAATFFDGRIYVLGGFGGPRVVERYDPLNRRWERAPDLPIGVDHPMAASVDGPNAGVYVIGGNSGGQQSARAFHLAPNASSWREVAPMPTPRSAGAAVQVSDPSQGNARPPWIVVVGGASPRGLESETLIYDTGSDSWRVGAPIPTPRDHLGAVWFDGVCAVGGRQLSMARNLAAFECYDPEANTWERLEAAPTARGGVGVAVASKRLFLIGGEQPSGTFKEVEFYDPATRAWSRGPDMPTPRHGIGVVGYGDDIYVISGGPTPGGSQTAVVEVLTVTRPR